MPPTCAPAPVAAIQGKPETSPRETPGPVRRELDCRDCWELLSRARRLPFPLGENSPCCLNAHCPQNRENRVVFSLSSPGGEGWGEEALFQPASRGSGEGKGEGRARGIGWARDLRVRLAGYAEESPGTPPGLSFRPRLKRQQTAKRGALSPRKRALPRSVEYPGQKG